MPFQMLVVMHVTDEQQYSQYRKEIAPLLTERGGTFEYDLKVSEVLATKAEHPINRVFLVTFPTQVAKNTFFADGRYQAIKAAYFEQSVAGFTIVSESEY